MTGFSRLDKVMHVYDFVMHDFSVHTALHVHVMCDFIPALNFTRQR